jgi:hypothetical protein
MRKYVTGLQESTCGHSSKTRKKSGYAPEIAWGKGMKTSHTMGLDVTQPVTLRISTDVY